MLLEELELWELLEPFPMLPEMLPETPPGEEGVGVLPFMEQQPAQPLLQAQHPRRRDGKSRKSFCFHQKSPVLPWIWPRPEAGGK